MIDNASLLIEELQIKLKKEDPSCVTTYKDAFLYFMNKQEIYDPIDLWEVIEPILKAKIRQEFIDTNNIPSLKQNNLSDFFA